MTDNTATASQPTTADTPETTFCDDCGEVLTFKAGTFQQYTSLQLNVASANRGESAILCAPCDKKGLAAIAKGGA